MVCRGGPEREIRDEIQALREDLHEARLDLPDNGRE